MQKMYLFLIVGCAIFGSTHAAAEELLVLETKIEGMRAKGEPVPVNLEAKAQYNRMLDYILPKIISSCAEARKRDAKYAKKYIKGDAETITLDDIHHKLKNVEKQVENLKAKREHIPESLDAELQFYAHLLMEVLYAYTSYMAPHCLIIGDLIYRRIFDLHFADNTDELSFCLKQAGMCYEKAICLGNFEASLKLAHMYETYWDLMGKSEKRCIKTAYSLLLALDEDSATPSEIKNTLESRKSSLRKRYPKYCKKKQKKRLA